LFSTQYCRDCATTTGTTYAKGYWIGRVDIADRNDTKPTWRPMQRRLQKYGARFLVRSGRSGPQGTAAPAM
jgi:uncharacterized protein (DUF1330 family)